MKLDSFASAFSGQELKRPDISHLGNHHEVIIHWMHMIRAIENRARQTDSSHG